MTDGERVRVISELELEDSRAAREALATVVALVLSDWKEGNTEERLNAINDANHKGDMEGVVGGLLGLLPFLYTRVKGLDKVVPSGQLEVLIRGYNDLAEAIRFTEGESTG